MDGTQESLPAYSQSYSELNYESSPSGETLRYADSESDDDNETQVASSHLLTEDESTVVTERETGRSYPSSNPPPYTDHINHDRADNIAANIQWNNGAHDMKNNFHQNETKIKDEGSEPVPDKSSEVRRRRCRSISRSSMCDPCFWKNRTIVDATAYCEKCDHCYCIKHAKYHDEVHQHQVMQTTTSLRRYSAAPHQRVQSLAEKSLTTHDVRIGNGQNGFRDDQKNRQLNFGGSSLSIFIQPSCDVTNASSAVVGSSRNLSLADSAISLHLQDTAMLRRNRESCSSGIRSCESISYGSSISGVVTEGWLHLKTTGLLKEYKEKYCVLYEDGTLLGFQSETPPNFSVKFAHLHLNLKDAKVVPRDQPAKGRSFLVTGIVDHFRDTKERKFYASSTIIRQNWLDAINIVSGT
ncbi:akt-1 [Bugula neritina]|uniref:Akt-1 n=1 Tax=Bugula neritina TaxID=10212 RepID=A0A7J7KCB8_BUGNE|nr:akt-1 [Bugula neritina]